MLSNLLEDNVVLLERLAAFDEDVTGVRSRVARHLEVVKAELRLPSFGVIAQVLLFVAKVLFSASRTYGETSVHGAIRSLIRFRQLARAPPAFL